VYLGTVDVFDFGNREGAEVVRGAIFLLLTGNMADFILGILFGTEGGGILGECSFRGDLQLENWGLISYNI